VSILLACELAKDRYSTTVLNMHIMLIAFESTGNVLLSDSYIESARLAGQVP